MSAMNDYFKTRFATEQATEAETLAEIKSWLPFDPYSAAAYAVSCGVADEVPKLLYALWISGEIPPEQLPYVIYAVWVRNRSPLSSLGERKWLALFKAMGFSIVNNGGGRTIDSSGHASAVQSSYTHLGSRPKVPIVVWRGCATSTRGRGMSWTMHRECANDFAKGVAAFGVEAGIYSATIPPRAVLALFGDEREQESVVNPNMLRGGISLDEIIPGVALRPWPGPE